MSLWHLLQTTDSLFPTGAFSHSGGLEGLELKTAEEAERAVREILGRSFATVDLPACARVWPSGTSFIAEPTSPAAVP